MTDACKRICAWLDCELEVFTGQKSEDELLELFAALQQQGQSQDFSPLFVIPDDTLAEAFELFLDEGWNGNSPTGMSDGIAYAFESAKKLDAASFLAERRREYAEEVPEDAALLGKFIAAEPTTKLNLCDLEGQLYPEIILAKIPAPAPSLAVWTPMGGFNDCPPPAEQLAVFRHWEKKYGAAPALVSYDVWQLTIANPPLSDEEAEELAWEHYAFCPDMVEQAPEEFASIRALASNLKGSTVWGFWWD